MAEPLLAAGRVAVVTGASSGIGEAFARALGARGLRLVLTGRDPGRLARIAAEVRDRRHVRVETVPLDLAAPDGPERLKAATDNLGLAPDILVNNAGLGLIGTFTDLPLERQLDSVRVNVEALVSLTSLYLPGLLARGRGGIVNVGSAAGFQPLPHYAVYAATKAFVASFSQALWAELRGKGISVVVCCPGPVADTRFAERAGGSSRTALPGLAARREVPRELVVDEALRGLERGELVVVPGLLTRLMAKVGGAAPRRFQLLVTERLFRPSAEHPTSSPRQTATGGPAPDGTPTGGPTPGGPA